MHVDDVLAAHGLDDDDRIRSRDRATTCAGARTRRDAVGHEITRARFHRLADAAVHGDGADRRALGARRRARRARLQDRDRCGASRGRDDEQARLQAFVLAPLAVGCRSAVADRVRAPRRRGRRRPGAVRARRRRPRARSRRSSVSRSPRSAPSEFDGVADADVCVRCRTVRSAPTRRRRASRSGRRLTTTSLASLRPMPATPTRPRRARMLWWGFTKRCPRCGSGHLFRRWFTIVERCPRCGLRFEREEGYWAGALAINIGIAAAVFIARVRDRHRAHRPRHPGGRAARDPRSRS